MSTNATHTTLTSYTCVEELKLFQFPMDSNTSSFLLNSSTLHSVFYQDKQDDGIIDLGLSLGTVQHEAYQSSSNCMSSSHPSFF